MNLMMLLQSTELFGDLSADELAEVAEICHQQTFAVGEVLAKQGEPGDELFIVKEGWVEIALQEEETSRTLVNLGAGQLIGEMSLVDRGPRSATVKAIHDPTVVHVIQHKDFQALCQRNTAIGYKVMLNLAADLSFKLRHRHLSVN